MRSEVVRIFIDRIPIYHNLDFGITYPTGMVEMDKQWYLFTVESSLEWYEVDMVFTNRIYQIAGRKCPLFGCNTTDDQRRSSIMSILLSVYHYI